MSFNKNQAASRCHSASLKHYGAPLDLTDPRESEPPMASTGQSHPLRSVSVAASNESEVIERSLLHKALDRQLDIWESHSGHGDIRIKVQKGQTVLLEFLASFKRHQLPELLSNEKS